VRCDRVRARRGARRPRSLPRSPEAPNTGAHLAADARAVLFRQLDPRLVDRHLGRRDPHLAEPGHALGFFEVHVVARIKILELRHRLHRQIRDVEGGRNPEAGASLDQAVPELPEGVPVRRKYAHAGDHHPVLAPDPIPFHKVMLREGQIYALFVAAWPLQTAPRRLSWGRPAAGWHPGLPGWRCKSPAHRSGHGRSRQRR
jgi:hypothetical protein